MHLVEVPEVWPPLDVTRDLPPALTRGLAGAAQVRPADPADPGAPWPRQFAVLLTEALAGARPLRQVLPWMSERAAVQLRRLQPLFGGGHRPRVLRVLTTAPGPDVIEMTLVVAAGPRTRAVAVRLERAPKVPASPGPKKAAPPWLCTDIEAA